MIKVAFILMYLIGFVMFLNWLGGAHMLGWFLILVVIPALIK